MRVLSDVIPTNEQLGILSRNDLGTEIIRGAAGSGKTTTALLRLRSLVGVFLNRRKRGKSEEPVRILVLTYNRTLRGYIKELAKSQVGEGEGLVRLEVSTFGKWAKENAPEVNIIDDNDRKREILRLGQSISLDQDFLLDEVEYILGRFTPHELNNYLTARRDGRGAVPRVDRYLRQKILSEVISPYCEYKRNINHWDWNDLALYFSNHISENRYDIIICDEAQDFSANQLRATLNQLAEKSSITFVLDTAQRIYARGYTWTEIGLNIRPEHVHRLSQNYRNTKQIASLAASLMQDMPADDDATLPNFMSSKREGKLPLLLSGSFNDQLNYTIDYIQANIDLNEKSVAFLHPLGGGWFKAIKDGLNAANLEFVEMTRREHWPVNGANIALCTLHSSKGLEFDHVFILGLNAEVTKHGADEHDDKLQTLRRLLAMGIGRAKESVILGCKPRAESQLIQYLDKNKINKVIV